MMQENSTANELVLEIPELNTINITLPFIPELNSYSAELKRAFDVTVAAIVSVTVLTWLFPLLYIAIKITSKGPVLFIQKRIGQHGKIFRCYKFRTMHPNMDADTREVMVNDKRITPVGALLRATHIDELPQLMNVLAGDMSIIGPRPHMLYHHKQFTKLMPEYNQRHLVKPGITGLAQVKGFHGTISSYHLISGRTKLDLFYTRKASLRLDLIILLKTITLIFHRKTSNHDKRSY